MALEPYEPLSREERKRAKRDALSIPSPEEIEALVERANHLIATIQCAGYSESDIDEAASELQEVIEESNTFSAIMALINDRILTSTEELEELHSEGE